MASGSTWLLLSFPYSLLMIGFVGYWSSSKPPSSLFTYWFWVGILTKDGLWDSFLFPSIFCDLSLFRLGVRLAVTWLLSRLARGFEMVPSLFWPFFTISGRSSSESWFIRGLLPLCLDPLSKSQIKVLVNMNFIIGSMGLLTWWININLKLRSSKVLHLDHAVVLNSLCSWDPSNIRVNRIVSHQFLRPASIFTLWQSLS